jgi:hypothetical protein
MAWINWWGHKPKDDRVLVGNLVWTKWKPTPGSDFDMNNWKSVEWWFRDYPPSSALIRAAIHDSMEMLGINRK